MRTPGIRITRPLSGILLWIQALALTLITTGCDHIELEDRPVSLRVPVRIEFDWTADPQAAPEEMTLYFYRISERGSTRNPLRYVYELRGCSGGTVMLPSGYYCAVCHNTDTDCHGLTGHENYDSFGIRLSDYMSTATSQYSRPIKVPGAEDERIATAADYIWIASLEGISVRQNPDPDSEMMTLVFEMIPVTQHYKFVVRNPSNITPSTRLSASVSGMASTIHPARGVTGEETVTHSFVVEANDKGELEGHLLTFGHCGNRPIGTRADDADHEEGIHNLVITDGHGWSYTHDITRFIHEYEEGPIIPYVEDITVVLDTLTVPLPPMQGGGMSPNVGGWTGEDEIITM